MLFFNSLFNKRHLFGGFNQYFSISFFESLQHIFRKGANLMLLFFFVNTNIYYHRIHFKWSSGKKFCTSMQHRRTFWSRRRQSLSGGIRAKERYSAVKPQLVAYNPLLQSNVTIEQFCMCLSYRSNNCGFFFKEKFYFLIMININSYFTTID